MYVSLNLKCDINNQVLTYPSWCVIRGQGEVAEAAQALHGRILDSFADGLDGKANARRTLGLTDSSDSFFQTWNDWPMLVVPCLAYLRIKNETMNAVQRGTG